MMLPMLHQMLRKCRRDTRGAAAIEFALVAPVFIAMIFGIVAYGGYFWRAHAIQQVAQDAARAALPGLTQIEREALARSAITSELAALGIAASRATPTVTEPAGTNTVVVQLSYDGSSDGFLNLSIVPLPSKTIQRIAAVRLGGL